MFRVRWWVGRRHEGNDTAGNGRQAVRRLRRYRPSFEILEARQAPAITLSISNPVPFPKPDAGPLFGVFLVTRSGDLAPEVLVDYATQDGTGPNGAHAGIDYVATSGSLDFFPNHVTATIVVPVLGNNVFQADKVFTVRLSNPRPAVNFAAQATFTAGSAPYAVAVGDFNGDGKPDLAIANGGAYGNRGTTISVLLNTTPPGAARPSFAPQQTFTVGSFPSAIAVGDFNGDGKPDLAVANANAQTVSVLLNTTPVGATTASFTQQTLAASRYAGSVAVADVNGDGKPDLIVSVPSAVAVLLNTTPAGATTASFAPPQTFPAGPYQAADITAADFNGDGRPDVAFINRLRGTASVLLNTTPAGATVPSFAPQRAFGAADEPTALAVGDLNGDGKPDLAVTSYQPGYVSVLLNTTPAGVTTPSFAPAQSFETGFGPRGVAVGDFDGDGKPDLAVAVAGASGAVGVLLNTTSLGATVPSFDIEWGFPAGRRPLGLAVADFNGDGKPDLATADYRSNAVSVLINSPSSIAAVASFAPQQTFRTGIQPYAAAVGDFNGDGKSDLAIANNNSGSVSVLLNTTPAGATIPSFAPQQTFPTGGWFPESVTVGDFNGDGKPDLAVANDIPFATGTVSVFLNTTPTGATVPSFAPRSDLPTGQFPVSVATADFNGDGKPDLAVANEESATVSVLLNATPAGATIPSFALAQNFATNNPPRSLVVGDLNGDGKPDIAAPDAYRAVVLLNLTPAGATTAAFTPYLTFSAGGGAYSMALGDLNGDGKADLAIADRYDDTVSVLLNTTPPGATTPSFAPPLTFTAGGLRTVSLGDFNGDGKLDLAIADESYDTVSVRLNETPAGATTPAFAAPQVFATGGEPIAVAVGDFNGDGKPDLAVPNFRDGTVSVLLNRSAPIILDENPATGTISSALNAPAALAVVAGTSPQSAAVTTAFTRPLAVDVRNAAGHLVRGVSVTFTAPGSGPSGSFGGSGSVTVVTDASGRATAPAFTADTFTGSYTLTVQATGGNNPGAIFSLTNTAAAASSFTLTDLPASLVAGTASTFTVTARDPFGNVATGYTGRVHFASTDPSATLPPDYTFTAPDHGAHTFAGLVLRIAGARFVVAYDSADGRIDGVSPGVNVVAAAPDHFAVTTAVADPEVAGTPFDVTVTVQDVFGNTATGYTGTVTFSSQDPYGATLPPDYTFLPDQGRATFRGGAALYTAGTWDVTATDTQGAMTGAAFVNVVAAPAVALQVVAPPEAASGAAFDVTVVAVDPYGNTDTNYQGTISFSITDQDPSVVLPPDYTFQPADQGVATFAGGVTLITPGDQTLTVSDADSGLTGSAIVTVSGPGASARVGRRPQRAARWPTTGGPATDHAEALDGLFITLERRRSVGRIGDALSGEWLG